LTMFWECCLMIFFRMKSFFTLFRNSSITTIAVITASSHSAAVCDKVKCSATA
jgi:hypothetical protein